MHFKLYEIYSFKLINSYIFDTVGHESVALEPLQFKLTLIEAATNNFSHENRIGRGGFGEVYKVRIVSCTYNILVIVHMNNDFFSFRVFLMEDK